MAFCGGRLGAETAELWCGGRNPLRRELASTLTSRFLGNTSTVSNTERHVGGDAPDEGAFSFFVYSV